MKFTLLLMLLSGPALAGGGSFFGPGGGGGSSSTGTLVDGADASLRNVTVQTLQSTGTAPSLTATGAVFTGSVTVLGTNGLAVGASQAIERARQASDYLLIGHPTNAGTNRSNIRYTGAGYFSSPSLANAESDGDKLVFYNGAGGKTAMGLGAAYDLWLQATGPGGGGSIAFWTGATGTASKNMTLDSSGNLGIGTASPATKLEIVGTHVNNRGILYLNGSDFSYAALEAPAGAQAGILFNRAGTSKWTIAHEGSGADALIFAEGGGITTPRMTLLAGGNLGIGADTTPDAHLEITQAATDNYVLRTSSPDAEATWFIDKFGHVVSSGAAPAIGTCTNGTVLAGSTDVSGRVNFTGANTSCSITFAFAAQAAQTVNCAVSRNMATPAFDNVAVTGTGLTVTLGGGGAFANTDSFSYVCYRNGGTY